MSISYGPKWNIVESYNATVTTPNPLLKISISSGGGDIGGTWDHTISSRGTQLYYGSIIRSYVASTYRMNAVTGVFANIASTRLDVYGSTTDAAAMNTFLTNVVSGDLLVITTWDEPNNNKNYFSQNLIDNFGSRLIGNSWEFRSEYLLVAVKGKKLPIYERYGARYQQSISATLWLS